MGLADGIAQKLDTIAELMAHIDVLEMEYQQKIDTVMAPVRDIAAALRDELESKTDGLRQEIAEMEDNVRQDVLALGESVKGLRRQAVYNKPRVSWDTRGLDGYAVAHPEIEHFRKVGEPSVSFREVR